MESAWLSAYYERVRDFPALEDELRPFGVESDRPPEDEEERERRVAVAAREWNRVFAAMAAAQGGRA